MVCVLFGHRDCPDDVREDLKKTIRKLIDDGGVKEFFIGNNGGFDAMGQSVLAEICREGVVIDYTIVLSRQNEEPLNGENRATLFPDGQERHPRRFAISKRNEWMLKRADVLIVFVRHPFSNSYKMLKKAQARGIRVINLCKDFVGGSSSARFMSS